MQCDLQFRFSQFRALFDKALVEVLCVSIVPIRVRKLCGAPCFQRPTTMPNGLFLFFILACHWYGEEKLPIQKTAFLEATTQHRLVYGKRDGLSFGLWLLESIDTKGTLQTTAFFSWWDTQEKESSMIRRGAKKKPLSEKRPSRLCQKLLPFSSDCVPFKENILLLKHCK